MQLERGLVTDHADLLRPQPGDDQILVLGGRESDDAVDPAHGPFEISRLDVLGEKLVRKAQRQGLPGGEVACLRGGELVERGPAGT